MDKNQQTKKMTALDKIDLGESPNSKDGTNLRNGGQIINANFKKVAEAVKNIEVSVESAGDSIANISNSLKDVSESSNEAKKNVEKLSSDLSEISDSVTSINVSIDGFKSDIENTNNALSSIVGTLNDHSKEISAQGDGINSLDGRVNALESSGGVGSIISGGGVHVFAKMIGQDGLDMVGRWLNDSRGLVLGEVGGNFGSDTVEIKRYINTPGGQAKADKDFFIGIGNMFINVHAIAMQEGGDKNIKNTIVGYFKLMETDPEKDEYENTVNEFSINFEMVDSEEMAGLGIKMGDSQIYNVPIFMEQKGGDKINWTGTKTPIKLVLTKLFSLDASQDVAAFVAIYSISIVGYTALGNKFNYPNTVETE